MEILKSTDPRWILNVLESFSGLSKITEHALNDSAYVTEAFERSSVFVSKIGEEYYLDFDKICKHLGADGQDFMPMVLSWTTSNPIETVDDLFFQPLSGKIWDRCSVAVGDDVLLFKQLVKGDPNG